MSPLLVVGHWLRHVDSTLDLKSEAPSYRDLTAPVRVFERSDSLPLTFPLQWLHCRF